MLVYTALLNAVTKELTRDGQRFGVVYDGEPLPYPDLAARLEIGAGALRWGLDVLRSKRLAGTLRAPHGLRVFLFDTRKWQKTNNPRVREMSRRYEWILEAVHEIDAELQSRGDAQIEVELQSPVVELQSLEVKLQSPSVEPQSQPPADQEIQQVSSSSNRFEHTEKEQGEQSRPNPTPSPSPLDSKPDGQGKAQQLVVELARISNDVSVVFDAKRQKELARLLTLYPAEAITKRWREYWSEVNGDQFKMSHAPRVFVETFEQQFGINTRREEKRRAKIETGIREQAVEQGIDAGDPDLSRNYVRAVFENLLKDRQQKASAGKVLRNTVVSLSDEGLPIVTREDRGPRGRGRCIDRSNGR